MFHDHGLGPAMRKALAHLSGASSLFQTQCALGARAKFAIAGIFRLAHYNPLLVPAPFKIMARRLQSANPLLFKSNFTPLVLTLPGNPKA
jgi:hypothetical protein